MISIHALREESDPKHLTPGKNHKISIHALREESDSTYAATGEGKEHFYPRPPRGERRAHFASGWSASKFLSTPSARRATGMTVSTVI